MPDGKDMEDRFTGGLSLTVLVNLATMVIVVAMWAIGLDRLQNQLLMWLEDAEQERLELREEVTTYHSDILVMIGGLNDVNGRVHNLEQYNLRKDPEFEMPIRRY